MSIEKINSFVIICDNCGDYYSQGNHIPSFASIVDAEIELDEQPDREWEEKDGKHYCPNCYKYDEETGEVVEHFKLK
ncbi:MAG: hypothetical protein ACK5M3_05410 [Dysgonomonas sp.]